MTFSITTKRRSLIVAVVAAFTATPAAGIAAQNVTLDFNTLTETIEGSGTRFVSNCYMENGFVLTAVGVSCDAPESDDAFLANGPNSPLFGGDDSPSMLLNTPDASEIDLMRGNGGAFGLVSIALSGFFGAETSVLFTGTTLTGMVAQMFNVGAAQQSYVFNSDFVNLTSVRISAMNDFDEPLVNFDDISLTVANVPEPASLALMLVGLMSLSLAAHRRRRA